MADRGDAYIIILRPAHINPTASMRASPSNAKRVAAIAAPKNPTSSMPKIIAVLACNYSKMHPPVIFY